MSAQQLLQKTDIKLSVKQTFGFESDMKVGAFSKRNCPSFALKKSKAKARFNKASVFI